MPEALICGGGVAGLSTALHLRRSGWQATIFESDTELRTAGVGLNIWPNGVRVLDGLGLGEQFRSFAAEIDRWWALDSDGEVTSDIDVRPWRTDLGAPITGARRRRLNAMLAAALDPADIVFEAAATGYTQGEDRVTLHLADGRRIDGDLLVGADGIGSQIRNTMLGAAPQFTTEGIYRWRGVFATADAGVPATVQADVYGADGHFGWIPIDATHAYWYGSVAGRTTIEEFRAVYDTWTATPVPRIIAASEPESIIGREIAHYREHLPHWVDGRVVLLGDAAHPMYPGMAQGANQALIDGRTLADMLVRDTDVPAALQAFQARRIPVANTMVDYSRLHFDYETTRKEYRSGQGNLQINRYLEFES